MLCLTHLAAALYSQPHADGDLLTSKVIPLAMSAAGTAAIVPGLYSM